MRRRLVVVVLATTTLVVVAFAIPLGALVRSVARDRAITAAERDASALAPVLAITAEPELIAAAIERTTVGADDRLTVVLPDGTALGDNEPVPSAELTVARSARSFSVSGEEGMSLYAPVVAGTGEVTVIRARIPVALLDAGVREAWIALALVAVGLVVAAVALADRLARSLTREADAVASTARELAAGDASARVAPGDTPELADAAHALNLLADRIDVLRAAERERVADLSHRLRTPLTALRLDADRAGAVDVIEDVDRLEAAVTDLVRAARRPLHTSPVAARCDVVEVVRERADYWAALAEDDGRDWSLHLPPGDSPDSTALGRSGLPRAEVALDRGELSAALDALLGNVFAHTPDGVPYRIVVELSGVEVTGAGVTGADVTVVVEDAGGGILRPDDVLVRGHSEGGSTGLGLDIVRQTAEAAGGALSILSGTTGGFRGARLELRLPLAPLR